VKEEVTHYGAKEGDFEEQEEREDRGEGGELGGNPDARWLTWTVLALVSWGVWAIMAKLIGGALSGAHNRLFSTLASCRHVV